MYVSKISEVSLYMVSLNLDIWCSKKKLTACATQIEKRQHINFVSAK